MDMGIGINYNTRRRTPQHIGKNTVEGNSVGVEAEQAGRNALRLPWY